MVVAGRAPVLERIEKLLASAREGHSSVLVVYGDPGAGKTMLCGEAVRRAKDMVVASTRGLASEARLPYAGLADLLRPTRPYWERLAPTQRKLLESAVALEPMRELRPERYAVYVAALAALSVATDERPLLMVIDDAQWLDGPSADAMRFIVRRLDAEPIACLVAARSGNATFADRCDLPEEELERLSGSDVETVLVDHGFAPSGAVVSRIAAATAGNPLAALECAKRLHADQLRGVQPLPELLPIGLRLEEAFSEQIAGLAPGTATALLVVATGDHGSLAELRRALEHLGGSLADLEPAESCGLVSMASGNAELRHPLVRLALQGRATPSERRRAHAALAASIAEPHRRAQHLGAATLGPDDDVAAVLGEAAAAAVDRGVPAAAVPLLERAAELSGHDADRGVLLAEAAACALQAGEHQRAGAIAGAALQFALSPQARGRLYHVRAVSTRTSGSSLEARQLLVDGARELEVDSPGTAAVLMADAAVMCVGSARIRLGRADIDRAVALGARAGWDEPSPQVESVLGLIEVMSGDSRSGRDRLVAHLDLIRASGSHFATLAGYALLISGDEDRGRECLESAIASARASGAVELLAYPLGHLADLEFRAGRWRQALASASEALALASVTDQETLRLFALSRLARCEAAVGDEASCRQHVEEVVSRTLDGTDTLAIFAYLSLALLEVGAGRFGRALEPLGEIRSILDAHGAQDHLLVPWFPDLVEALVAGSQREEALGVLADVEPSLRADDRPWCQAVLARAEGLCADDPAVMEEAFARSLRHHLGAAMPFDRARTQLLLGGCRRRAGLAKEAREPLRAALATFNRLGARSFAARCERELAAAGDRLAARSGPSLSAALSPQEFQVATFVARGLTNREVAAALFLSPKTVEAHLGRAYRKLSVRSRSQLARLFASTGTDSD